MAKKETDSIAARLIRSVLARIARLPRRQLIRLAPVLGRLWYVADRYHRRIAFENMTIAFGREKPAAEIEALVKASFVQLVRVMLEIPYLLRLDRNNLDDWVEFSGLEHLEKALDGGGGVLLLTAHLGNWELMAVASALKCGYPFNVLARPLDYAPIDRVLTEIRSRTGNRVLNKNHSAAEVGALLRENQAIGILLDQNSSWYEGVYVPFFGRTACTNRGLATFALRYGAAVIPAFNFRRPDGRYRVVIEAPLELSRSGSITRDIIENTARFNRIIEKYIRLAPDNWLWVHRRWRIKKIPEKVRRKVRGTLGGGDL